jgi:glycosyltransferase involved in cell wall biosynthesis
MTAILSIPGCKWLKIKLINGMIVDAPAGWNYKNKYYRRAKLSFLFSDIVISNSKAGLTAYKAPGYKSIIIPNGFNFNRLVNSASKIELRSALSISTPYVIGMVASYSKFKDYPTYFRAASMMLEKRKDITFLAIGNNTDLQSTRLHLDEKHWGNFRFLGRRSDVEALVGIMDICVLASFTEGISNSILEYMANSKAVIATRGGGTEEIVVDGITGVLCKTSDADDLAEKIEWVLNNPSLRNQMGEEGRKRVEQYFSISRMIEAYRQCYDSLVTLA